MYNLVVIHHLSADGLMLLGSCISVDRVTTKFRWYPTKRAVPAAFYGREGPFGRIPSNCVLYIYKTSTWSIRRSRPGQNAKQLAESISKCFTFHENNFLVLIGFKFQWGWFLKPNSQVSISPGAGQVLNRQVLLICHFPFHVVSSQ